MPLSLDVGNEIIRQIVFSIIGLVVIIVTVSLLRRLVLRYIEEPTRRYRTSKFIRRAEALLILIILIMIWSPGQGNIIAILTLIGAGLAIAMREALLSIAGWLNVILRNTYSQGDRIEVNGIRGDVIDIRLFHTTLMEVGAWVDADQSTGRIVHIPNSWVFQYGVHNYTKGFGFIWNEISVTVTFRSDWAAAKEIMLKFAQESSDIVEQQAARQIRRMSREYLVHYSILTPFVYVRIVNNGVQLTLRYLCEVRKRRGTEHALTVSMLDAFREHGGIELAYPMVGITTFTTGQFEAPQKLTQNRDSSPPLPPDAPGGTTAPK